MACTAAQHKIPTLPHTYILQRRTRAAPLYAKPRREVQWGGVGKVRKRDQQIRPDRNKIHPLPSTFQATNLLTPNLTPNYVYSVSARGVCACVRVAREHVAGVICGVAGGCV